MIIRKKFATLYRKDIVDVFLDKDPYTNHLEAAYESDHNTLVIDIKSNEIVSQKGFTDRASDLAEIHYFLEFTKFSKEEMMKQM